MGDIKSSDSDLDLDEIFAEVVELSTVYEALRALADGRIHFLFLEVNVATWFLDQYFPESQDVISRLRLAGEQWMGFTDEFSQHLVVNAENPKAARFLDDFNESLAKVRARGTHRLLMRCYGLESKTIWRVRLNGSGKFPVAVGTHEKSENARGFLIPPGTRAVVVQWSDHFKREKNFDVRQEMREKSRLRILEGPLEDQILWVPNRFISFE